MSSSSSTRRISGGEIVTIQCGSAANWIGVQYHLLQNSNCDVNSPFSRSAHFRRSAADAQSSTQGIVGERDTSSVWMPRLVSIDASVGLDGVVATFKTQQDEQQQEAAVAEFALKARSQQKNDASSSSGSTQKKNTRPQHWSELSKNVMPFHHKSLYSVPGLYEGTNDFHLHSQGREIMEREAVSEEVIDRVRWFLEECDQPDGLHLLVDGNTGWSGVGSALLSQLRDEYEKLPIFCISSLLPPSPASLLGQTFSSRTNTLHSVLNSSLLLHSASQLATAYLPLTTQYWLNSPIASKLLPDVQAQIKKGEMYESCTLLAWAVHLATADYRTQPRQTNMATTLAGLTQQTRANILAAKLITHEQLDELNQSTAAQFNQSDSSSNVRASSVVHTLKDAPKLSFLGHHHAFRRHLSDDDDYDSLNTQDRNEHEKKRDNGFDQSLTEMIHAFGRTEEMSHVQMIERLESQPKALYRRVFGTTRMNLPPSFPIGYYDLLNDGHALSVYRSQSVGRELAALGSWMTHLNRGIVTASHYTVSSARDHSAASDIPIILDHLLAQRHRNINPADVDEDGDVVQGKSPDLVMPQWAQEELEEFVECGASMQNDAEAY